MEKRSILFIVCVVLVSMVLGLVSVSAPKQVRADEPPPVSPGPNAKIPLEYGDPFDEAVFNEDPGTVEQIYLTDNPELNNEIMSGTQIISYGALGFTINRGSFMYYFYGCRANNDPQDGINTYQTVSLPHGSRITYIDFSGSDDSSTDEMFLSFTRNSYDNQSGIELARLYSGSSFSGGRFVVGKSLDHQVINTTYSYLLTISFPKFVSGKNLCANQVTIWYTPPSVFALALPLIER